MSHRIEERIGRGPRRLVSASVASLAVLTAVGLVALWPGDRPEADLRDIGVVRDIVQAEVLSVDEGPCEGTDPELDIRCFTLRLRVEQGSGAGDVVEISLSVGRLTPRFEPGDAVVLAHNPDAEPGFRYSLLDRQRRPVLLWLGALFALAVVALGGLRGLAALAGLAASLVLLLVFIIPAILEGTDPLLVAIVGASAIAFLALYVAHGFNVMTSVALLGTLASLALTAVLAEIFVSLAQVTGFASEEAALVNIGAAQIDLAGLVLGGVVIGALGAIDDMTVTQASAMWELRSANPRIPRARLMRAGLRVGRDHIASTVNTLMLAYAGASMPLLILFVLSGQSLGSVANGETVATEIIRTLVGSIGLVASVPLTTWLAGWVLAGHADERSTPLPAD